MLKAIELCILLFTIYIGVKTLLKHASEENEVHSELLRLFRHTLVGVKTYMKPIDRLVASFSSPVLNKYRLCEYILNRDITGIKGCEILPDNTKELLCGYIIDSGSADLSCEVARLEELILELDRITSSTKDSLFKKRRLYTTLGASLCFAVIIFVI